MSSGAAASSSSSSVTPALSTLSLRVSVLEAHVMGTSAAQTTHTAAAAAAGATAAAAGRAGARGSTTPASQQQQQQQQRGGGAGGGSSAASAAARTLEDRVAMLESTLAAAESEQTRKYLRLCGELRQMTPHLQLALTTSEAKARVLEARKDDIAQASNMLSSVSSLEHFADAGDLQGMHSKLPEMLDVIERVRRLQSELGEQAPVIEELADVYVRLVQSLSARFAELQREVNSLRVQRGLPLR